MNRISLILVTLILVICNFFASAAAQITLELGSAHRRSSIFTIDQKNIAWDLEDIALNSGVPSINSIIAYISPSEANPSYVLEEQYSIAEIIPTENSVHGPWPLSTPDPCAGQLDCREPWWKGRWSSEELLEQQIIDRFPNGMDWGSLLSPPVSFMGCMQTNSPLRYGDIDNDGTSELVVILSSGYSLDWLIFSIELGKTIFLSKLNYNDVIPDGGFPAYLQPDDQSKKYQYWLRSGVDKDRPGSMRPALKSFAKLYFGDFDNDGQFDILVWRKLYQSLLMSNPTLGYELINELFAHYENINSEYHMQDTLPTDIENWLSINQLTWQNGYPSISECPGEEGQLIPEMHDPLLNDPEVLQ